MPYKRITNWLPKGSFSEMVEDFGGVQYNNIRYIIKRHPDMHAKYAFFRNRNWTEKERQVKVIKMSPEFEKLFDEFVIMSGKRYLRRFKK
ncbi:MAG: hypothetical protein CMI54_03495 [Parcubacteria group bacterium]|jgi:hypothetical protein|nr:hypothetical protein [Parcubacteria group bacterium]|tara:strand:- start:5954 stop:6223 length:270 start_codon:yes stop_codon:yes gene_type:complete